MGVNDRLRVAVQEFRGPQIAVDIETHGLQLRCKPAIENDDRFLV